MGTEIISIRVDVEAARAFNSVSDDDRRKLEALLSIRLTEIAHSEESLDSVVQDIRRKAVERGLTSEIFKALLDEK